ncbi:MAG TPA: VLRF1 family aeRF1-type release factor [Bacillales bacterium]|nr:VLRF1 family aeRF1-type release factor [Bacillales bacterium]
MTLNKQLDELKNKEFQAPKKVLSLYLNTDLSQQSQQEGEWKIRLKNGLKRIQEYVENSGDKEELKQFKSTRKAVENKIYENEKSLSRSIVIFATADEEIWVAEKLPVPVETEFYWESSPVTTQFQSLKKDYPFMAVVLIQKNEAAVLETEWGILMDKSRYTLDLNTNDWREHQGPQGDDLTRGGSKKDEFDDRLEANRNRWFKQLVSKIEKKAGNRNWEKLFLVGEKDEVENLKSHFSKTIDKTIPRNLLNRKDQDILSEVLG